MVMVRLVNTAGLSAAGGRRDQAGHGGGGQERARTGQGGAAGRGKYRRHNRTGDEHRGGGSGHDGDARLAGHGQARRRARWPSMALLDDVGLLCHLVAPSTPVNGPSRKR
jgi:hypothetical protein